MEQAMSEWMKKNQKTLYYISAGLILLCCVATRLWRVTTIPSGVHIDEAGMAYDAWCLSQYGVDRYLTPWPVYLNNFGGGQSILYAYLLAGLFKLFGYHFLLVRLPSAFFSFLSVLFGMKVAKRLYPGNLLLPLAAGVLLTVCPYLILIGRLGIDCFLMLGASAVFLYYFLCAVEEMKYGYYIAAGITGGILLYSYILTYLILPAFLLLAILYLAWQKRFSVSHLLAMAIPMGLLAFPLILTQLVNLFGWESIRLGIFTCPSLISYRTYEIKTTFQLSFLQELIHNVFFDGRFEYCSAPGYPNLYYTTIPFFLLGLAASVRNLFVSIKKRQHDSRTLVFLWLLLMILLFCHVCPNGYRICGIYFGVILVTVEGLRCFLWFFSDVLRGKASVCLSAVVPLLTAAVYLIAFVRFGCYYYLGNYTNENYPLNHFDIPVTEAVAFLRENPQYGPKGTQLAEAPILFALSTLDSPYDLLLLDPQELLVLDYYHCSCLGEIEDGYNYIVRDIYYEYAQKLRDAGFTEINYGNYSLFYQETLSEG